MKQENGICPKGTLLDFRWGQPITSRSAAVEFDEGKIGSLELLGGELNPDLVLMAPFANGHDHVRGIRPVALGAFDLPLELWLTAMSNIPPVDPHLVASVALGRQVLGGMGSIMIHYTRPRDPARVVEELETVAKAARTIGVRIAIAVAMRDENPLGYIPSEEILGALEPSDRAAIRERLLAVPKSPDEQMRIVDDLADRVEGPLVDVQYGPYGPEWCSDALLERIALRSADTGRRVHMHLMESRVQREYLDHKHACSPIAHLDRLGLLSPRLSVAHAIWLRPDEMDLLAERGVTVCTNASSNLSLRSGAAPLRDLHSRGVRFGMGLDGFSVDDDDDAFRELRLNWMLHKGVSLEDGIPMGDLFAAACHGGRHGITGRDPHGGLCVGGMGDLMTLDYGAISRDIIVDADPASVVMHRGTSRLIKRMIVNGREIAADGVLTGIDLGEATSELNAQARHGAPAYRSWREVSDRLGARLRHVYGSGLHCCG